MLAVGYEKKKIEMMERGKVTMVFGRGDHPSKQRNAFGWEHYGQSYIDLSY